MNSKSINKGNTLIYIFGLIIGLLSTIFLMCIFSFVMTLTDMNDVFANVFGLISISLGSFIGAFYIGTKTKKGGLIIGAINGFIVLFLIEITSVLLGEFDFNLMLLIKILLVALSSLAGGIIAVNRVAKRKI